MESSTEKFTTPKERSMVAIAIGMIFGMIWVGLFLLFAVKGYSESGETGLAYAAVLAAISFPSSLLLNLIPYVNANDMDSISLLFLIAVFTLGSLQWFWLIPCLLGKIISYIKND